jgi:hypothetical protein
LRAWRQTVILTLLAILVFSMGCGAPLRNTQLETVAKDWALVIRASQVIPVYPLSEDLQPGDVLLVGTPIEEQVALYKEKGFLPLDQHLVRLHSEDFPEFYRFRYGITDTTMPPGHWQKQNGDGQHNWKSAPHAAFPTYQFSVHSGSGLNLAIPIQGVPFALGLMNSRSASGTVTIADVYTYGLDNVRLDSLVRDWAKKNRTLLRSYEPHGGAHHFLRVVSRVYLTGRVSVTVNNDEATGAEAAAGVERPVELMLAGEGSPEEDYVKTIETINKFADEHLPGAKVKIATATSRSVTLSEEFERPLVIGYIGFDMAILKGGRLGIPISTLAQLKDERRLQASARGSVYHLAALSHMYEALKEIPGSRAQRVRSRLDVLDGLLPEYYRFSLYEFASPTEIRKDSVIVAGAKVDGNGFGTVLDFLNHAETTIETLQAYLPTALRGTEEQRRVAVELEQELRSARAAFEEITELLRLEPALMQAIDFVFYGD